jgi:hypothetical protein
MLAAACQVPLPEMTEAEIAEVEAEIEEYYLAYGEAWEALDLS